MNHQGMETARLGSWNNLLVHDINLHLQHMIDQRKDTVLVTDK
jgi:hypothetical protein